MADVDPKLAAPSLDAVRARLDEIDAALLALVDERAGLAKDVATAKAAAGDGDKFALRPGRETALLRRLLARPRTAARPSLVVRIWRELIGDSLSRQGPFHINVWGGKDPARAVEFARHRFGAAPPLRTLAKPEEALAAAKTLGGVGVLALAADSALVGPAAGRSQAAGVRRPPLPRRLGSDERAGRRRGRGRAHRR
jgi:chorismate mutase